MGLTTFIPHLTPDKRVPVTIISKIIAGQLKVEVSPHGYQMDVHVSELDHPGGITGIYNEAKHWH
jgi:hypothetical protein